MSNWDITPEAGFDDGGSGYVDTAGTYYVEIVEVNPLDDWLDITFKVIADNDHGQTGCTHRERFFPPTGEPEKRKWKLKRMTWLVVATGRYTQQQFDTAAAEGRTMKVDWPGLQGSRLVIEIEDKENSDYMSCAFRGFHACDSSKAKGLPITDAPTPAAPSPVDDLIG